MCGISGQLNWNAGPDEGLVARMTRTIRHRGPDGEGLKTIGPVSLGHRRLAIIDLSPGASQPMTDVGETMWIVFNGEIYNYRELRAELAGLGRRFRSQSDTEVILESYKQWGVECLARFNGMFALALWDGNARTLLLARDRLGKKPLYYHVRPDRTVTFASELKALCEDPRLDRRLNPRALSQYLSLNYTLSSDVIIEGVRKLRPGHYAVCAREQPLAEKPYWDLAGHFQRPSPYRSPAEAAEALRALMDDSVRARLVSDVPLGVFLSGGLDSSTLAASMCQALPPAEVRSFSMGFREKSFSEIGEARATAAGLGVTHRDIETDADVAKLLPRIAYYADEPFADTSIIPTYLLAEFARKHVTVCLAGDGGDEVFAGYETYVADKLHHLFQWLPSPIVRGAAAVAPALLPVSFDKVSLDYKVRQFLSGQGYSQARAHYHWRTIFSEAEKAELLVPEIWRQVAPHDPGEEFEKFDRDVAGCDYLSRALYVDVKTWLVDDILVKADRASMAHGLEVRTPFLDYRVVEFAASLPIEWKLNGLKKKYILKLSQRGRLPDAILDRRKQGVNAPVSHWLLSSFRSEFERMTIEAPRPELQLFKPAAVKKLWDEHISGQRDNGHKLLGLINLQLWVRHYEPRLH
jgi:asparagine synthase (glutamine-hydrolysing)